jgi:hypothetical protein
VNKLHLLHGCSNVHPTLVLTIPSRIMASELGNEWYATLGPDLSQGDIVRTIPWGLIEAPLTICQPANADPMGKSLYFPLDEVPKRRRLEFLHARFELGFGLVMWPDCQIDKAKNQGKPENKWFAGVAPVIPLTTLETNLHDQVRNFNRAQWFPLPARSPDFPESYIDLRHVWPVRYALLKDRILTLSGAARQVLSLHRFWFDTEVKVTPEVECPHCHKPVDSSVLFKTKAPAE